MKYFGKNALACLMLLLAGNNLSACELPAHPNAAAMPVSITPKGGEEIPIDKAKDIVKLVEDRSNGNFYYLIPEGSKVKMKIVWDPLCHNSGAEGDEWTYKYEQYDYVKKGEVPGVNVDNEIGEVAGFYFFPLKAMSNFFKVSGNRNDVEEAFSREIKVSTKDEMIPDEAGLGPSYIYERAFSKGSTKLEIEVKVNEKNSKYSDDPTIKPSYDSYKNTNDLSDALPGIHKNYRIIDDNKENRKIYILEDKKLKLQKNKDGIIAFNAAVIKDSDDLIVYYDSGIQINNPTIDVTTPEPKDYKAYLVKSENDRKIHAEGIGYDPDAENAACGGSDGKFEVVFTTPTIAESGDKDDAIFKIKVKSPPAGYEMGNVFWVWKEQYYERVKPQEMLEVEGESETIDGSDDKYWIYKKKDAVKNCCCETVVIFNKTQDAQGYSGYKIYDDCGPISTKLELIEVNNNLSFAESEGKAEKTTFKYKISLIDSNPFLDKEIVATPAEYDKNDENFKKDISQNKDRMEVTFYYNYPVYKYKQKTINSIDDLKGCGLVDFPTDKKSGATADFRTYDYDIQWYWKKAVDVKVDSLKNDEVYKDIATDRVIGSKSTIEGTFTIDNPKPWHVTENYPQIDSVINGFTNFAVFAVLKDTAGNTHLTEVYNANKTDTELPSANPENLSDKEYAVFPNESTSKVITANLDEKTAPALVNDLKDNESWASSNWQNIEHLNSDDKTAPEIQIIVYDTRTNHYHIFGTKDNVAAGFNNFAETLHTNYASIIDTVPYIGKNTAISNSYAYTTFEDMNTLYNRYLQVKTSGVAVTTIEDSLNKNGFVCQKGTRLIFYVHAFDNIGFKNAANQGVAKLEVKLVDCVANDAGEVKTLTDGTFFENVFRQENYDKEGNLKSGMQPYKLIVTAKDDKQPESEANERVFELDIAVLGRTLDIRTLEEKRERIE